MFECIKPWLLGGGSSGSSPQAEEGGTGKFESSGGGCFERGQESDRIEVKRRNARELIESQKWAGKDGKG